MKPFIFSFLTLALVGCQSNRKSSTQLNDTDTSAQLDLNQLLADTEECGREGTLLKRIHDCREKNPAISQYRTVNKGIGWQQIMYLKKENFHLWMDQAQDLIWSSPLAADQLNFCIRWLDFKNGNKELIVRWPTLAEYRKLFEYNFPPLLYNHKARFFKHNDLNEANMAVDEKFGKFQNSPDDQRIWMRCLAE